MNEKYLSLRLKSFDKLKNISTYKTHDLVFYDKNKLAKIFC